MRKTKKRRGRGEGSIYQRESDGRWVGSVVIGYNAEGKPRRKVVYGDTKEEAQRLLHDLLQKVQTGEADRGEVLLKGKLDWWLDCNVKARVDPATYALHKQRVTDYILPYLGHYPVAALNEFMVRTWYEDLAKAGCSSDLRNKCGQLLRRCLDKCVSDGDIKTNPTRKLCLPRVIAEEMHPLDAEQARAFLAVASRHRRAALWLLALDSGMRQGEILALTWADVDFANGVISVTKSVRTGDKGAARVKEVKTKASRRRIRVTHRTLDALTALRKQSRGPLVFAKSTRAAHHGQPRHINKANLIRSFRLLLHQAGLPKVRFHDLRHTHATFALQATKNIKAVSARLGHADVRVTLNTYAHYLPLMEEEYVSAMETLLKTPAPPATVSKQETGNVLY